MTGNANRQTTKRRQTLDGRIIDLASEAIERGRWPLVEKILRAVIDNKPFRQRIIKAQASDSPGVAIRAEIKRFFGADVLSTN